MADAVAFMAQLPEQDRLPFRNLALIRPQVPTEGQLLLIESLARTLASPRLLTLIARTPHWLVNGPVLQALAQNDATHLYIGTVPRNWGPGRRGPHLPGRSPQSSRIGPQKRRSVDRPDQPAQCPQRTNFTCRRAGGPGHVRRSG